MRKTINMSTLFMHLLFFVILIYAYQDFISSTNIGVREANRGFVHITLFGLIILLSMYYIVSLLSKGINKDNVKVSIWLIIGWILFVGLIQGVNRWAMVVHLGLSLLWILIYHYGKEYIAPNFISKSPINKWIIVLFFFYVYSAVYAAYNIRLTYGTTPVVNLVYYVLVFFPLISFLPSRRKRLFLNTIITMIVLFSFKRGAIIIFPLMLTVHSFVKAKVENRKIAGIAKVIILIGIFVGGLLLIDNYNGGFILERFTLESLESGSGRSDLYNIAINNIKGRSFVDFIIGLGSGSSIQLLGTGAHNEWIEFTFSFGIVGLILYANLIIKLILRGKYYTKIKSELAPAYASLIVYMVVIGLFGGLFFVHSTIYVMLFLGIVEGHVKYERNNREMRFNEKNRNNNIS